MPCLDHLRLGGLVLESRCSPSNYESIQMSVPKQRSGTMAAVSKDSSFGSPARRRESSPGAPARSGPARLTVAEFTTHSRVQVHPWPPRGHLSPMHGVGGSRQRSRNDLRPLRANQCVISMRSCVPPSFPVWLQHLLLAELLVDVQSERECVVG